MTQKRQIKIRTRADFYGSERSPIDTGFGFVFSSDIRDWQYSKRIKTNERVREVYKQKKAA